MDPQPISSSAMRAMEPETFVQLLRVSTNRQSLMESYLQEQVARLMGVNAGELESRSESANVSIDSLTSRQLLRNIKSSLGIVLQQATLPSAFSYSLHFHWITTLISWLIAKEACFSKRFSLSIWASRWSLPIRASWPWACSSRYSSMPDDWASFAP